MEITPQNSFFDFQLSHRKWDEALAQTYQYLSFAEPGDVVTLIGPSRVGKTRLIKTVCKMIANVAVSEKDQLIKPVVMVDAKNTGPNGTFISKQFIDHCLEAAEHPIFSNKAQSLTGDTSSYYTSNNEYNLRKALKEVFIAGKKRYFVIDEAHHIGYSVDKKNSPKAILDGLKCFASEVGIVLVIVGSYPLLEIMAESPHMCGRASDVHLSRYTTSTEDLITFRDIVNNFADNLSLDKKLLETELDQLYKYSFGCIGLLRLWFKKMKAMQLACKKELDETIITNCRTPAVFCDSIEAEIVAGERLYEELAVDDSCSKTTGRHPKAVKKKKSKPFQKKPMRHVPGERK